MSKHISWIKDHPCTPRFVCLDCRPPLNFTSKSELTKHLRFSHPYTENKCDLCSNVAGTKTHLQRHKQRFHNAQKSAMEQIVPPSTTMAGSASNSTGTEDSEDSEKVIFEGEVDIDPGIVAEKSKDELLNRSEDHLQVLFL